MGSTSDWLRRQGDGWSVRPCIFGPRRVGRLDGQITKVRAGKPGRGASVGGGTIEGSHFLITWTEEVHCPGTIGDGKRDDLAGASARWDFPWCIAAALLRWAFDTAIEIVTAVA